MADEQLGTIRIVTEAAERQVEKAYKEAGQAAGRASGSTFGDAVRNKIVGLARRFGGSSGGELASAAIGRFSRSAAAAPGDRGSPVQSAVTGATAGRLAARGGAQAQASAAGGLAARGGGAAAASGASLGSIGAIALPVAAVAAFALGLKKALGTLRKWDQRLQANSERFARINASFARVRAQAGIRQLRRDLIAADELAPTFARSERFRQGLQDATLDERIRLQRAGSNLGNVFELTKAGAIIVSDALLSKFTLPIAESESVQSTIRRVAETARFMADQLGLIQESSNSIENKLNRQSNDKIIEESNEKMTREIRELSGMMGQPDDPFFQGNP